MGVLVNIVKITARTEEGNKQIMTLRDILIEAFKEADKSGDGSINQEEWAQMATNDRVRGALVKLGVQEGAMTERLNQMEETLFGARHHAHHADGTHRFAQG